MEIALIPIAWVYGLAILLGAVFGSFINAVAWRIPNGVSIADGRSRCPQCGDPIAWYDNVPIVSYLVLHGRCRRCHKTIPPRYLLTEVIAAAGFGWQAYLFPNPLVWLWATVFFCLLLLLAIIDLETMLLPNILTLPGALLFLAASFVPGIPVAPADAFAAAFGAAGMLFSIGFIYKRLRGRDGLGLGDVKLMLLLGAVLGVQKTLVALIVGSSGGALIGVGLLLIKGGNLRLRLPFGPFLAAGALVSLWFGDQLVPLFFPTSGL